MDKDEANRIAQLIATGAPLFTLIGVEVNAVTGKYEVKCEYHGPTRRLGNKQLEGKITCWIKTPADWIAHLAIATRGIEVK
jgi:hypothetical protein